MSEPDPVDSRVGANVRLRRKTLGFSQQAMVEAIGLTFQQVQKYERGANRISASMLHRIATVLKCPVADLFQGLPAETSPTSDPDGFGAIGREFLSSDGGLDLARAYLALPRDHRRAILAAVRAMAESVANDRGRRP